MKKIVAIFCFSLWINGIVAQVPTNGLVAEYLFSEGSYDDTNPNGYGPNHAVGTATVANAVDRFGNADAAKYLSGINYLEAEGTHIKLGSSGVLKPENGTISIWVKLKGISYSGWGYVYNPIILAPNTLSPRPPFEGYALYLHMEGGTKAITSNPGAFEPIAVAGGKAAVDRWHHYVVTYDERDLKLYENGVLVKTTYKGYRSNGVFSNEDVVVGSSMNEINNRAFNGTVDDIRIYNRMLSDAEVLALYQESVAEVVSYVPLQEVLDAGFYPLTNGSKSVYFYYEERYQEGILNYKVFDQNHTDITTSVTLENIDLNNSRNKAYGRNRYKLTLQTVNANEFYLLEVTNEKGKKQYLKFLQI